MSREDTIRALAARLGFQTLERRNLDSLDFHEVAVWEVKDALEAAYDAGAASGASQAIVNKGPIRQQIHVKSGTMEIVVGGRRIK